MLRVERVIDATRHDVRAMASVSRTGHSLTQEQRRAVFEMLLRCRLVECGRGEIRDYARKHGVPAHEEEVLLDALEKLAPDALGGRPGVPPQPT